jgi:hypothetical protein
VAPQEARASEAVPRLLTEAVGRVIEGDYTKARASLRAIDFRGLQRERAAAFDAVRSQGFARDRTLDPELKDREGPSEAQKRQVYKRDSFTCWFCGKRTIYAPVLLGISARLSEELPYRSANWKPVEDHILYWTCTASWDHRHPVARLVANAGSLLIIRGAAAESLNVRGAYLEVLGDLLGSVAVIVAAVVVAVTGFWAADAIASVLIGVLILPRTWRLLREAVNVLLQATLEDVDLEAVRRHVLETPGVAGVHDLHAWTLTSGMNVVSAHVELEDGADPPAVLERLCLCLSGDFDVEHSTYQLEWPERRPPERALHR